MATITLETQLVTHDCGTCSGTYAINARFDREKRAKGGSWYCPYCRASWSYTESDVSRLQKQLKRAEELRIRERQAHDQTKADLRETELKRRAEKSAKTRIQNRVERGVCIHCNRTFQDLQRHMATKHKEHTCQVT